MNADPMGLAAGYGAGSVGASIEDMVKHRLLQEQQRLAIAKAIADQQNEQARIGQAQQTITNQASQFGQRIGLDTRDQGFRERQYADAEPQRVETVRGLRVANTAGETKNTETARAIGRREEARPKVDPNILNMQDAGVDTSPIDTQLGEKQKGAEHLANIHGANAIAAANASRASRGLGDLTPAQAQAAFKLQDDFQRDSKPFLQMRDAFQRVASASKNPDAAGDLSLIFAYMKILDPNSVVREAEFANAQNAAGVPDQVRNLYNRALSGERLNPNQRQQFTQQAQKLYGNAQRNQQQVMSQYSTRAQQFGLDPSYVISNLETGDETSAAAPAEGAGGAKRYKFNPQTGQIEPQ